MEGGNIDNFPQIKPVPSVPDRTPKPMLKMALGVVIGVVVLGGAFAAVLASRLYDPLWSPFRPEPEQVIKMAMANMSALKTVHSEAKVDFSMKTILPVQNIEMSFIGTGDSDNADVKNPKSSSVINISISGDAGNYNFQAQTRVIGADGYLILNNIDDLADFLANFGLDSASIQNQWIKMDESSLPLLTGREIDSAAGEQTAKKIEEMLLSKNLLVVKKELDDGSINGNIAYHYLISLDKEITKDIFSEIVEGQALMPDNQGISPAMISSAARGMIDNIFAAVGEISFDLWIGKEDLFVHRAALEKTIDLTTLLSNFYGENDLGWPRGSIIIRFEMDFSDFNKPVQIVAPISSVDLKEVAADAMQKYQLLSSDADIAGNMGAIQLSAETIYNTNRSYYSLSCSTNIKPHCDRIKMIVGTSPVVRVSKTKYCAYAKLTAPDNYFCIDNEGYYQVDISPAGRGYCAGTTFVCPRAQGIK